MEDQVLQTGVEYEEKRFGLTSFLMVNPHQLKCSGSLPLPWEKDGRRLWPSAPGFGLLILLREHLACAMWPLHCLEKQ